MGPLHRCIGGIGLLRGMVVGWRGLRGGRKVLVGGRGEGVGNKWVKGRGWGCIWLLRVGRMGSFARLYILFTF